jgi:hypothetical protein
MSEEIRHRSNTSTRTGAPEGDVPSSTLAAQRADLERLFSVASRAFAGLNMGDSQEFINSSRQTGGQ